MSGAKAQPTTRLLPVVSGRRNCELRTGCWVRRVQHDNGKARGVVYVNGDGEEVFQPAGMVFLASWTLNNTRLLLLSRIGKPYDPPSGESTFGPHLTHQLPITPAIAVF